EKPPCCILIIYYPGKSLHTVMNIEYDTYNEKEVISFPGERWEVIEEGITVYSDSPTMYTREIRTFFLIFRGYVYDPPDFDGWRKYINPKINVTSQQLIDFVEVMKERFNTSRDVYDLIYI